MGPKENASFQNATHHLVDPSKLITHVLDLLAKVHNTPCAAFDVIHWPFVCGGRRDRDHAQEPGHTDWSGFCGLRRRALRARAGCPLAFASHQFVIVNLLAFLPDLFLPLQRNPVKMLQLPGLQDSVCSVLPTTSLSHCSSNSYETSASVARPAHGVAVACRSERVVQCKPQQIGMCCILVA